MVLTEPMDKAEQILILSIAKAFHRHEASTDRFNVRHVTRHMWQMCEDSMQKMGSISTGRTIKTISQTRHNTLHHLFCWLNVWRGSQL